MNATSNPQTAAEQGRKNNRDVTTADAVCAGERASHGREGRGSEPRSL